MNNWYVWKCYLVRYDMCRYCMRSCFVVTLLATSSDGSSLFESAASSFRGNSENFPFPLRSLSHSHTIVFHFRRKLVAAEYIFVDRQRMFNWIELFINKKTKVNRENFPVSLALSFFFSGKLLLLHEKEKNISRKNRNLWRFTVRKLHFWDRFSSFQCWLRFAYNLLWYVCWFAHLNFFASHGNALTLEHFLLHLLLHKTNNYYFTLIHRELLLLLYFLFFFVA